MTAYGQCVPVLPDEVVVDGLVDSKGEFTIEYWGVARRQPDGKYRCYANISGVLCAVEVGIKLLKAP